jgi:hypothetical protein
LPTVQVRPASDFSGFRRIHLKKYFWPVQYFLRHQERSIRLFQFTTAASATGI